MKSRLVGPALVLSLVVTSCSSDGSTAESETAGDTGTTEVSVDEVESVESAQTDEEPVHIDTEANGQLAYSSFISDADMLSNGNVLVTHGGIGTFPPTPEDPLRILIREVVPDGASGGDVVWELAGVPGFVTYRAERLATFYFGPQFAT